METLITPYLENMPIVVLFIGIIGTLLLLGKGADLLVDEAVSLSVKWKIPKVLIGATIVSLGTTLPEAAVSVLAAVQGKPGLALGNAVGSIICDTGLIIGVASLISPLVLDKRTVNRQGWLQMGAGFLLVLFALPWISFFSGGKEGFQPGVIYQWVGFLFVILLAIYLWITIRWSRDALISSEEFEEVEDKPVPILILKLTLGVGLIIISSKLLIPTVQVTAVRIGIPQSIIAATLVAFGTSLPELVTAVTAARKGHGELAIGNIIGADILNVLFVVGFSASVTKGGLAVPLNFYTLQFPAMLLILATFKLITHVEKVSIKKHHGIILLIFYLVYTAGSYLL
ncbi:MAG: calcium/sodium antiporter [Spirochaetales bacterium]|nr:calcium/sodium antiporter [Spirochaetales bacterium]